MKTGFLSLIVKCLPLVVVLAIVGCSSSESPDRPGSPTKYWGSGQPAQEAHTNWIATAGWRNQRGLLGDVYGPKAPEPAPEPPKPAPPKPVPPPPPVADLSRCQMAFPTGDRATSVILLETMTPVEVRVGQAYDYEMRVTNLTSMVVEDVMVTDVLQGNYTMSGSNPAAARSSGNEVAWNLGRLNAGETKSIKVTGTAAAAGAVTRCTKVTYNSQCCVTTRVVAPALQLKKTAPAEVLACDPIELTFTVTNSGTGAARNVRIEDALPQGWTTQDGQKTVTLDAGTLDSGQSRDFKVTVKTAGPGRFENTATAKAEGGLEAKSNTTMTVAKTCVLVITKTAPEKRFIGREIEYEINVSNKGDGVARDAMLEDTLPAGSRFVKASDGGAEAGGKITWRLGNMEPGASKKVTCAVVVGTDGMARNSATVRAYCCPPVSAEAQTKVEGIPAILLEVVDDPDPIEIGKEVVYTIDVTNQGSATDKNIVVTCTLEPGMAFVSGDGATKLAGAPATTGGGTFAFQPLPSLAAKQKATWKVRVKALQPGDVRFKLSMKSDMIERPVEETEATRFY